MDLSRALLAPSAPLRKGQGEQLPPLPPSSGIAGFDRFSMKSTGVDF